MSIPCSICLLILGCLVFTRKAYVLSRNLEAEFKKRSVHVWHNILLSVGQSSDSQLTCRFYSFLAPLTVKPHQISRNIQRRKQAPLCCTVSLLSGKSSLSEMRTEPPWKHAAQRAEVRNMGWLVFLSLPCWIFKQRPDCRQHAVICKTKHQPSPGKKAAPYLPFPLNPSSPGTFILPKGWSRVLWIKAIWDGLSSVP